MNTYTDTARPGGIRTGLRRGEAWLDAKGKWAWIAAMILGFVFFWPVGLALLAYMIWGKHMFARSCGQSRHNHSDAHAWGRHGLRAAQPTGNHAFDSYKAEALRRLEEEQEAFETFLQRLRTSKDKTQFDAFMDERARATAAADSEAAPDADAAMGSSAAKPETGARPGEY
jgi:Protein of unknown function (DUF2852)